MDWKESVDKEVDNLISKQGYSSIDLLYSKIALESTGILNWSLSIDRIFIKGRCNPCRKVRLPIS
jgi:hypothetical protein